jgi:hypothetical protein
MGRGRNFRRNDAGQLSQERKRLIYRYVADGADAGEPETVVPFAPTPALSALEPPAGGRAKAAPREWEPASVPATDVPPWWESDGRRRFALDLTVRVPRAELVSYLFAIAAAIVVGVVIPQLLK